jgi:uncharacterized membrane protein YccC
VFGRFSQPLAGSAGLAGLVLAGGLAQVLFLSIVRWPTPLRVQRSATAAAYRALSDLARGSSDTSTLPVGAALDEALDTLSSLTLFGDPALMTLRSLVNDGHRMRIELSAIHSLMRRQPRRAGDPSRDAVERVLEATGATLDLIARAAEADRSAAAALPKRLRQLSRQVETLAPGGDAVAPPLARRLSALAGQLRAAGALADGISEGRSLRERRPQRHIGRPLESVATEVAQLRADVSVASPVGRHALRLAVVVVVAELISRQLPLARGYWMVVAAALTLRPEFGATFTRGAERALATCIGVALAGAIAVGLHPAGGLTIALVGVLAWAGYAVFPASFAAGFTFITALVVFLLNSISPDTLAVAGDRLLDTLIGGALGLLIYALWPTWSDAPARQALADLVAAYRAYIGAILAGMTDGRPADEAQMLGLSRQLRLARTGAESTVARSLTEPATRRIDAAQSQGTLSAMRRLAQAGHVLRLGAQEAHARSSLPALAPLAAGIDAALTSVEVALRPGANEHPPARARPLPDLRARYREFERSAPGELDREGVLDELDEVVDATNGLAALVGLDGAVA